MRPIFHADLINRPFGDPGVFIDLKFERRAILFDIGDIAVLPTRKLLRVSDVFVSHTHMDHFSGFDYLLRVCLGRDTGVSLYGPEQFITQLEHKLAAYTWNLVENYETEFVVVAHEIDSRGCVQRAQFRRKIQPGEERSSGPKHPILFLYNRFRNLLQPRRRLGVRQIDKPWTGTDRLGWRGR